MVRLEPFGVEIDPCPVYTEGYGNDSGQMEVGE